MRSSALSIILFIIIIICYSNWPLEPFSDRLSKINSYDTYVDALYYNHPHWTKRWTIGEHLDLLHQILNPGRISYALEKWELHITSETPPKDRSYVDVGCGGGVATEEFRLTLPYIVGVDPGTFVVEAARLRAVAYGMTEHQAIKFYKKGSLEYPGLSLGDSSIDAIFLSRVFELIHDLNYAVHEMKRVLRPGGVIVFDCIDRSLWSHLIVTVMLQNILRIIPYRSYDSRLFIQPNELVLLFKNAGFYIPTNIESEWEGMALVMDPTKFGSSWNSGVSMTRTLFGTSMIYMGWVRKPNKDN